jgi:hypothetical protein
LLAKENRKEFIFQIMIAIVFGGEYCQYEDNWDEYEKIITSTY